MSEQAVADFVGRFAVDPSTGVDGDPRAGRVVMSKRRLVLAHDDGQITIPFGNVVDVVVGNVPDELRDLFDDTVTIAYENDDRTRTVLIEGREGTIPKFVGVLFKCLLNGTEGVVSHPARVGGRVLETAERPARIRVGTDEVAFQTPDNSFRVGVQSLVGLGRTDTAPDGSDRRALALTYDDDGRVVTSLVSTDSSRSLQLLGRYVGREYRERRAAVAELELDTTQLRVLVALYTGGGDLDLEAVVGEAPTEPDDVVHSLSELDLVADESGGPSLTTRGRIAVLERFGEAVE